MRIHVRADITMQTMVPGDAGKVFDVIEININNGVSENWRCAKQKHRH